MIHTTGRNSAAFLLCFARSILHAVARSLPSTVERWTLPLLPLALNAELRMPVDLEATYMDAWQRRRLT
ncbi:MAG TPA: hypothetical protein VN688_04265 [Gemmataceae bacterium]|nr:hypothetical protein [Gemmataceae bacterium]